MRYLITVALIFILISCGPEPKEPNSEVLPEYRGIFILNEGQWTYNNASLTYYDGQKAYQNVFYSVNNTKLGDVANDIFLDKDTLYVIVNNSKIIYKVQMPNLKLISQLALPQSASPRTLVKISPTKAYVNSMLDNSVYIINPVEMKITGTISIENYSEDMILTNNKVYTSLGNYAYPKKNNKIAVINPNTDIVEKYIALPMENPGDLEVIDSSTIVVIAHGNYGNPKKSALYFINTITDEIKDSVVFNNYSFDAFFKKPFLFIITDEGVTKVNTLNKNTEVNFLTKQMLNVGQNELLYAFYYDYFSQKYYITNAKSGGINGVCYVLDTNFNKITEFPTGVYPGTIFNYQ